MKLLRSIVNLYKTAAVIILTTTLLLVTVISSLALYESRQGIDISKANPRVYNMMIGRDHDSLHTVYPEMPLGDIQELLLETWTRPYLYEPFTQFRERPYSGKYVNVDQAGFRHVARQAPWPPRRQDYVIFVFGGSTTFGYGVSDGETIPSRLLEILETALPEQSLAIYNFGRGFFYSTQERILFEHLLTRGFVPSMAIFIDGLNEFYHHENKPMMTDRLSAFVNKPVKQETFSSILSELNKQAVDIGKYLQHDVMQDKVPFLGREMNEDVTRNYFENKRLITAVSSEYGVVPVFVWQPVPTYKYFVLHHLFASGGFDRHIASSSGYSYMHKIVNNNQDNSHFLWLADIQEDLNKPLYVDKAHYTAEFSELIAGKIADYLIDEELIRLDLN